MGILSIDQTGNTNVVQNVPALHVPSPLPSNFPTTSSELISLLNDINSVSQELLGDKVAKYAGFYLDSGNNILFDAATTDVGNGDDQPDDPDKATQPNKSFDKLTFCIMFRLPFLTKEVVTVVIGSKEVQYLNHTTRIIAKETSTGNFFITLNSKKKYITSSKGTDLEGFNLYKEGNDYFIYLYEKYYGNPLVDNTTLTKNPTPAYGSPSTTKSWSYRANLVRAALTSLNLKYLNQAGEQVNNNTDKVPCDDTGVALGVQYDTPVAYVYYSFSNINVDMQAVIECTSLYAYLLLTTEGSFDPTTFDKTFTQQPENIIGVMGKIKDPDSTFHKPPKPVYKSKVIQIGQYNTTKTIFTPGVPGTVNFVDSYIQKESQGMYYVQISNVKYYVKLYYSEEDLYNDIFELESLKIASYKINNGSTNASNASPHPYLFIATYWVKDNDNDYSQDFGFNIPTSINENVQFDKIKIPAKSGVTIGWGQDIGAGWPNKNYYNIFFDILVYQNHSTQTPNTKGFKLYYKGGTRVSDLIKFDAACDDVLTAIANLLELSPGLIIVDTNSTTLSGYVSGWSVSIRRIQDTSKINSFYNIYSSNVFYHTEDVAEIMPNVKINPPSEKGRFLVNSAATAAWTEFTTQMTNYFNGTDWLALAHFASGSVKADQDLFQELVKRSLGIQKGPAFLITRNFRNFLQKFSLPNAPDFYPPFIQYFVLPKYFNPIYATISAFERSRMSVAEKYILLTRSYSGAGSADEGLKQAIREKNLELLIQFVTDKNTVISEEGVDTLITRRTTIIANLNTFRKTLYRNVTL